MITVTLIVALFIVWGMFLSALSHRLIHTDRFFASPGCGTCGSVVAWYELIPGIISTYHRCGHSVSYLDRIVPIVSGLLCSALYFSHVYFWGYFLFVSALLITIQSDLQTMLISRWVTSMLVPVGIIFSFFDCIPIPPIDSILSAGFGYGFLWLIAFLFQRATGKKGMGEGDFELMAFIGSFIGIIGAWASLLIGSILGSLCGVMILHCRGTLSRSAKIPFGPFLATGALIYLFYQEWFYTHFIGF